MRLLSKFVVYLFISPMANVVHTLRFKLTIFCTRIFSIQSFAYVIAVGFVGADCSLPIDVVPAISGFRRNCTCDVRQWRCARVYVRATHIYRSERLTCRVQSANSYIDAVIMLPYSLWLDSIVVTD